MEKIGMSKALPTIKVSGGDYAKVAARLKEFREENPRSKQESAYIITDDGHVVFTVWLWKDKSDIIELMKAGVTDQEVLRSSADSNGTAKNLGSKDKDFEKLESVALGRALANLGYLASGEIASSEEMERFQKFEAERKQLEVDNAIVKLQACKSLDDLKAAFSSLGELMRNEYVVKVKDGMKERLSENS